MSAGSAAGGAAARPGCAPGPGPEPRRPGGAAGRPCARRRAPPGPRVALAAALDQAAPAPFARPGARRMAMAAGRLGGSRCPQGGADAAGKKHAIAFGEIGPQPFSLRLRKPVAHERPAGGAPP